METDQPTLYVGGDWIAAGGACLDVVDPTTETAIAQIPSATPEEVDRAVTAAERARRDWSRRPAPERSLYLRQIARLLREGCDAFASLLVREVGKPIGDARQEVDDAADYLDYMAEWDRRIEGEIVPADSAGETVLLQRVPVGVVAAITAWNFPLALLARKIGPALVTGNSVVVKPTEVTPLSTIELFRRIARELDLPPGVLNLVTGGRETGQALVRHPGVHMITMTGHRDTGKRIMADAAANLTRVALELGGSAPAIVLADADLDAAVESLVESRFMNAGQVCTSAERIFVHEAVHDRFLERFTEAAKSLRVGNPHEDVDMGPLVNAAQFDKVGRAVAEAREAGGRLTTGGARPETFERGYWFAPTVIAEASPSMTVMREETFGPVAPVMRVSGLEEALRLANDTRYGLSAFVFTNDYRAAMRASEALEFGELYINRTMGEALQAHHIGHKESGFGGEDGKHGVLKYTQIKTVYHHYG